jgi:hypothetical protein
VKSELKSYFRGTHKRQNATNSKNIEIDEFHALCRRKEFQTISNIPQYIEVEDC